jgi:hypothetical protein
MYQLRRNGFPYKKPDQQGFLPWTIPLQNALVRADAHANFDWDTLKFGEELNLLTRHGIKVIDTDYLVFRNDVSQANKSKIYDDDGYGAWTVVTPKDKFIAEKHILRKCGMLPLQTNPKNKKKELY